MGIFDLFGPPNVEKMLAKKDLEGLINAFHHKEVSIRAKAAKALIVIGDAKAIIPFIVEFQDKNSSIREIVKDAFVKWGEPAIEPLIDVLKGMDVELRTDAAFLLGKIGKRAVYPLLNAIAFKDNSNTLRKSAAEALGRIGVPAIDPLINSLEHSTHEPDAVREAMAYALGKIGAPAVEPLIAKLKKGDIINGEIERAFGNAFENIGIPAVVPLSAALMHLHDETKKIIVEVLDKIGYKPDTDKQRAHYHIAKHNWDECVRIGAPAVEPLSSVLETISSDIRKPAAEALLKVLDKIGNSPETDKLRVRCFIAKGDWDGCVKVGEPAVDPLITKLLNWQHGQYEMVAAALGKIGAPAVEPLIAVLNQSNYYKIRAEIIQALGETRDVRAVVPLIAELERKQDDKEPYVRARAAEGLGKIGDTRAVEPLIVALNDFTWKVVAAAAWALGEIGDSRAIDMLTSFLIKRGGSLDTQEAIKLLGEIKYAWADWSILSLGKDMDIYFRAIATDALRKIRDARASAQ